MIRILRNLAPLSINVSVTDDEVHECYSKSRNSQNNTLNNNRYYTSYLKHVLGKEYNEADIKSIFIKLDCMKDHVDFCLSKSKDKALVIECLEKNNHFSKNTSRPGVVVKLFQTEYNGKQCVVKTYIYDGRSHELKWSFEQNVKNEILFQNYARTLNKQLDFISPELYSWGLIRGYKPVPESHKFKVIYLIMEYIPFIRLKDISYQQSNIKELYERVDAIDKELKGQLLHHNDLHSSNVLVSCDSLSLSQSLSLSPSICIVDFGEASCGPRKVII
jgi:hypothetical protein